MATRFDELEKLQEAFNDDSAVLDSLVRAMSDSEFHENYVFICRMHDIDTGEEEEE